MRPIGLLVIIAGLNAAACDDGQDYAQAVCVLADTSGTYVDQLGEVVETLRRGVLPRLHPGDTLIVARIDDTSYEKDNVVLRLTLDARPSVANAQKQQGAAALASLARAPGRARYTDIRGGILLCGDYLRDTHAGHKAIVIFSDLREELPRGARRALPVGELADVRLIAMNVKRLASDARDPATYRARLASWSTTAKASGASEFRVVLEPEKLVDYLDGLR